MERDNVVKEAEHFELPAPDFSRLDALEAEMEDFKHILTANSEFDKQLADFRAKEWITFRKTTYEFEDFLSEWKKRLREDAKLSGTDVASTGKTKDKKKVFWIHSYVVCTCLLFSTFFRLSSNTPCIHLP